MKPIHIHFVCTGNVYRSRLAETYLRSKKLPNIKVSSSGIKAAEQRGISISYYAARLITRDKLTAHLTPMWTQTSLEILKNADVVIFMTNEHHAYAKATFGFESSSYEIWGIKDLKDAGFTDEQIMETSDLERIQHTEKAFEEIKKKLTILRRGLSMQIVKHSQINKGSPVAGTTIWEYPTNDKDISGAVAEIHGRYPEKGFAVNEKSKELVFVLSGNGKVILPTGSRDIDLGDVIFIDKNEKFAWSGGMTIFMATTPKFNPKQHKIITM